MLWRQNRLSFMSPIMVFKKVPSTEVRSLFRKSSGVIQFLCVTLWEHIPRMGISGATVIIILTLHSHFFVLNHGWWGHGKLFNVRQAGYNHLSLHLSVQLTSFHCFCCFLGFFFSIFAVPSLVISSDAAVHSVHWLVDDMCPLNRGREKKRHDRDGKTRGFPPSLNGVYSIKTDAGSNFMVSTLREKKKIKRIKSCIKYISMECLLFTFSIFWTCKEQKRWNCNSSTAFVQKRLIKKQFCC